MSSPDNNHEPSPEVQSTNKDSNSTPDPDVILIDNDAATDSKMVVEGGSGKERSEVWNHYTKKTLDDVLKAVCKYCSKQLKGDSGSDHPQLAAYNFNQEVAKTEIAKMIVMHEYPLCIVDQIGFKRYSAVLQPLFKVPSRNTIKSEIFHIYEYEKAKTSSLLESISSRIAITTDLWTANNQKKGYMAVTAHFIDGSWMLQSRIMRFIYVPCPHTKDVLCEYLLKCLMDWNVDTKISSLTVDNCSTNDAMIEILLDKMDSASLIQGGSLFHMRCSAHILNLIVKDGLDVIKSGVEKIRDSVVYWTATPKKEEKFEETARQLRIASTKKLGLDCATRWNSTYLMLERALIYKDVFNRLGQRESNYKTLPSREDWDFTLDVC
nr:PREDICTED: zinc finger BED domain-containing protein RICESLEEPER 2-like [Daucus carota subsp. sativus]